MTRQILVTCIMLSGVLFAQAQSTATTSGSEASGSGGTVSYTVGQTAYQTHTGTNGSISEGVQQPYEISVVSGLEETTDISLSVSAYPNPTTDCLTLKVDAERSRNMNFYLYDMQGKLLQSQKLTGNETSIVMNKLVPAIYFVKVIQGNKEVKTFKIIKK